MIATITLNPAIDLTVRADHFQPDTVNRAQESHINAGGKGINVAAFLADYGLDVVATGFLGAQNADIFERLFATKGISDRCIRIPGATRIGVKIIDEARQQTTDVNLPGLTPPSEALDMLWSTVATLSASCDWFALAGNLPPGVPATLYAELITYLKERGKRVVLDTSGEVLRAGIQAGPSIIKPNVEELRELTGLPLTDERAIAATARDLLAAGVDLVAVSMGKRGALFCDRHQTLVAVPPATLVKSAVGAGDALVAGIIAGLDKRLDLAQCAKLATGFAVAAISTIGANLASPHVPEAHAQRVVTRTLVEPGDVTYERSLPATE